jgi:chaperone modulatory protein CbpM
MMQTLEPEWMDSVEPLALDEVARMTGLPAAELDELLDYGALTPLEPEGGILLFPLHCVTPLRRAARLRRDYDLDLFAMVVVLDQLRRIESLEQQLHTLTARR